MAAKHALDRGEFRLSFEQYHPTSLVECAARCQAVGGLRFKGLSADRRYFRREVCRPSWGAS